jgi:hypothetical protein
MFRTPCPHCRESIDLDLGPDAPRIGALMEQGAPVLGISTSKRCPLCDAGLWVRVDPDGVDVSLSHEPRHPRWSARGLEWGNGHDLAVASIEGKGVTVVRRRGLDFTISAVLARCEHYGFDPLGQRLLVDFTPIPRVEEDERKLAIWTPSNGDVEPLASSPVHVRTPVLGRSRSSHDAIGWHRRGQHVLAVTAPRPDEVLVTAWSASGDGVCTERIPAIARGRAWLEPGGDRLLWEQHDSGNQCRLFLVRLDPLTTKGTVTVSPLGAHRPSPTMDLCDVVWEADGSLLLAYFQHDGGVGSYEHVPYGIMRLSPKLHVTARRFPLEPELRPPYPVGPAKAFEPASLFEGPRGDIIFVTDRAYALDFDDFHPKSVLPPNMNGAQAFRFDPTGEVVAIAGPSDIHVAALATGKRASLRTLLG